jgi:MYXO-CTERM domain-containing protein
MVRDFLSESRMRSAMGFLGIVGLVAAVGCDDNRTGTVGAVRLERGAHPLAQARYDIGLLAPDLRLENMSLVFKLSADQMRDRDALLADQLNPSSPSYHQWLTPEDYAARFGARPADIARATAWLQAHRLNVHSTSRLGARVTFSGTVADIQTAFHAEMHQYRVNNETHYAMATAPMIPAELADIVLALHNSHDFYPRPAIRSLPDYKNGATLGLAPADWAAVYDVAKLYSPGIGGKLLTGAGVTIAVVGVAQVGQGDINAFRTRFGLPASTVTMTLVPNTGAASASTGAGIEAYLDLEWSGGIAKNANIHYVFTGAADGNVDDATFYAIENNLAPIISESFGGCELGLPASDADVLQTLGAAANLLGITFLASSGDSGAAGCEPQNGPGLYVELPAALPGTTAVGGSEFPAGSITYNASGNATGYSNQEKVWNESATETAPGAGGGGISSVFSRPSYQSSVPTCTIVGTLPVQENPATMREVPDIALSAASGSNPYFIECTLNSTLTDCTASGIFPVVIPVGGTSAGTPSFAGVIALLNEAVGGRVGNINPLLYQLAASSPTAFHDLTSGSNEIQCKATEIGCSGLGVYGYAAAAGYDCATGLGSIDAYNLVAAWVALAPTASTIAAAPTTTSEGANVTLTANVTVANPNTSVLGGTVTFVFQSYLASGVPDLSWTLGTAPISGATTSTGTAALVTVIPPGLVNPAAQYVDVVAQYGGDTHHLASTSTLVRENFSPMTFCISPGSAAVGPDGGIQYSALGGVAPVMWVIDSDTTCDTNNNCSNIDQDSGVFNAGPQAGYVVVAGLDQEGAEGLSQVTVGSPTTQPPWGSTGPTPGVCPSSPDAGGSSDAGSTSDAGGFPDAGGTTDAGSTPDAGGSGNDAGAATDAGANLDAGTPADAGASTDAGTQPDAGSTSPSDSGTGSQPDAGSGGGSSGCGCTADPSGATAFAGLLTIGLRAARRRKQRR